MKLVFRFKVLVILILFAGCVKSCEFQPHDIPMADTDKPPDTGPPLMLNLNNYHDTIKIGYLTNFQYSVTGAGNRILSVNISIGDKVIHEYTSDDPRTFSFTLDPMGYPDGKYHLNIRIATSTGSGSIADRVGLEGYLYELDWPLVIDTKIPQGPYFITLEKVHNPEGVKLSWKKFNHPNFIRYVILRQFIPYQASPQIIAEIIDPEQATFTDRYFWEGQDAVYFVRIVTPFGNHDGAPSTFQDVLAGFSAAWHDDGTLDVGWGKARNTDMFGGYYISVGYGPVPFDSLYIENPEENHATFRNTGFANGIIISLAIVPKGLPDSDYNKLKPTSYFHYTQPDIPLFTDARGVNNRNFILLTRDIRIYKYYPEEKRTDNTIQVSMPRTNLISVTNDGSRFAYFSEDRFHVRRTDDFTLESVFSGPSIEYPGQITDLSLSDNNLLLAADSWGELFLYDASTGQLVRKDSIPIYRWTDFVLAISPDGTRMIVSTESEGLVYYSIDPSGLTPVGTEEPDVSDVFYSKDGLYVFLIRYDAIIKRRAGDFGFVSMHPLPGGYYSSPDIDRDRLLHSIGFGAGYNIIDINTGQVLKTINLGTDMNRYTLFKNHIVTSGRQLNLPQF